MTNLRRHKFARNFNKLEQTRPNMESPRIGFMKNNTQVVQYSGNRNHKLKIELATTEAKTTTFFSRITSCYFYQKQRRKDTQSYSQQPQYDAKLSTTTTFASKPTTVQIQTTNKTRHYKTWPFQTICEQGEFET
jgi:hypothetical protein